MFSQCVQLSTWKYLKGNSCMKSAHIWGYSSLACVYIIPYMLHPIHPDPRSTRTLMLEYMASSGLCFCWWSQTAPPNASHLYMRHPVVRGIHKYHCHSITSRLQPWTMYLATLGSYHSPYCLHALQNAGRVASRLVSPCSTPYEVGLLISWKTSQTTAPESIQHYQNYPMAASSVTSPNYLQLQSPSAGVHVKAVPNGSAPG